MDEQAAFLARIHDHRAKGAQTLLDSGVEPDARLIQELRTPGADQRYGVNLIVRPSPPVIAYIRALQQRLRAREPDQYYYPADDLHLTLIEICSSQPQVDVERLAAAVAQALPAVLESAPSALLVRPLLGYDRRACVLHFLPANQALQSLRRHVVNQLAAHAFSVAPRYVPQSAHVTIMRYLQPLHTDPTAWIETLAQAAPASTVEWQLESLWLTWGATWYGMQARTQMRGPYPL
jgi:2'-5' RNA ligase